MNYLIILGIAAVIPGLLISHLNATQDDGPVRHVVVFKYKDGASEQQIQQITDAFRELQHKIDGIQSFEYGFNNSPEGHDQGFTHVYLITFDSIESRDEYLPHPEHREFGALLGELDILDGVFVVDYIPRE